MEAAMPYPNGANDPFSALTQRFAAMDAAADEDYKKAKETIAGGKAAVKRLKQTAERTVTGDTPSKTKLCIKAFSESDEDHMDAIEEAHEKAERDRNLPVTEVLDPNEVRRRLDAAAAARSDPPSSAG